MGYGIERTGTFDEWFLRLAKVDRTRLVSRIERIRNGNFGDHKKIDENFFELRCFFGGGLRLYYTIRNHAVVFLLAGGNKDTQSRDIQRARQMLNELTKG
ncbi:MAG: type II toxin-antitoxin system RelE/ParE family toxin [Candidatus Accumulibacter sp.]|nr:type II toxin-antitoxin system RelE/ParE family toxin [Accumulibacter sp.]